MQHMYSRVQYSLNKYMTGGQRLLVHYIGQYSQLSGQSNRRSCVASVVISIS